MAVKYDATYYTTLYVTVSDGEIWFEVPTDWLKRKVLHYYQMELDEFMSEYTSCESVEIYAAGILDGVITL